MEYRMLGRTGVEVSVLCLGAMNFGAWGKTSPEESTAIVHAALDAGINFVDTADAYSRGQSEEILGAALAGRRDEVVLATKFRWEMGDHRNMSGMSRRWIMRACEDSLRRLGTDHIDLYQLHKLVPDTDIDETLGALSDLVHQGKIRYFGSSAFPASDIVEAQWTAERRGRERFRCEQPSYSILVRDAETEVFPVCQRYGMGVITFSPLSAGFLSGRWRPGAVPDGATTVRSEHVPPFFDLSVPENQRKLEIAESLAKLAAEAGLTLIELAVAWVLRHPAVTAAIIGPRTMDQLVSQLGAPAVHLDDDLLDRIDELVPPGTNVNPQDVAFIPFPTLEPKVRRRPA